MVVPVVVVVVVVVISIAEPFPWLSQRLPNRTGLWAAALPTTVFVVR